MRAREFTYEAKRQPELTLRHLNKLKNETRIRQTEIDQRNALLPIMYGNPAKEIERIELEKAYIELEQLKTELALTKSEAEQKNKETLYKMALSGIAVRKDK